MKRLLVMAMGMVAVVTTGMAQATVASAPVEIKEESPDTGLSVDASVDILSGYIWRGYVVNDRPVWQPEGTITYDTGDFGAFSIDVWANLDMTDRNGRTTGAGLNEVDYTASYSIDVSDFTFDAGHIWYVFPKVSGPDASSTREVYGSVAYNNDIVTPSLALYYDYAEVDGYYGLAGLSKEISLADQLTLGLETSLGWGDDDYMGYFGMDDSGLMDFNAGVSLTYALTDNLSVGAKVVWTSLIDGDARDKDAYRAAGSWDKDILWGGVNLAASF